MATKKCANGHLYDPAIYGDKCPFCQPAKNVIDIMIELGLQTGKLELIRESSHSVDFSTVAALYDYIEKHPHIERNCSVGHKYSIGNGVNIPYGHCYVVMDEQMFNDCPICENTMRIKKWMCDVEGGEEIFMKFFDKSRYAANHNQYIKTVKI